MSGLWRVMWHEAAGRQILLPAAFVLGVVPLGLSSVFEPETLGIAAFVIATLVAMLTGLVMGASILGRDLAEGRLGFFFARPLSWGDIWGGKMLSAIALTVATPGVSLIPVSIGARSAIAAAIAWHDEFPILLAPRTVPVALCWALILVGMGHTVMVAYRGRSAWSLFDLACVVAVSSAFPAMFAGFERSSAFDEKLQLLLLSVPAMALTFSSALQVAIGRTDIKRCHAVLSLTLWPALGAWAFVFHAHAVSLQFAPKEDRHGERAVRWADAAPQGPWVMITPNGKGEGPWSLLDTRVPRIGWAMGWSRGVVSRDGRFAAWPAYDGMAFLDLESGRPPSILPSPSSGNLLALSPDGTRLLTLSDTSELVVHGTTTGQRLLSIRRSAPSVLGQAGFVTSSRIRAFAGDGNFFEIIDIDVDTGRSETTGRIEARGNAWAPQFLYGQRHETWEGGFRLDPSGRRAIMATPGTRVTLRDGLTGALIVPLTSDASGFHDLDFLEDGRIALVHRSARRLQIFSADGHPEVEVEDVGWIGGQPDAQRLFVRSGEGRDTVLINVSSGRILSRHRGLEPVAHPPESFRRSTDPIKRIVAGAEATKLFLGGRHLVHLDPDSGARTVIWPQ